MEKNKHLLQRKKKPIEWSFDDDDIKLIINGLDLIKESLYTKEDKKLIPRIEENKQKFIEYQERCNLMKPILEEFNKVIKNDLH